jgi:hypothetical protein
MKIIELKSRQLLRKIFNGVSITAIAFIFQACYGMPHDGYCDFRLSGTVVSKTTSSPIKGIKVSVDDGTNFVLTDVNGKFDFYAYIPNCNSQVGVAVHFLDIDGDENGLFNDITMAVKPAKNGEVNMNVVELEEKQ